MSRQLALEAPSDDALGMDPDNRLWPIKRLGSTANLDSTRLPGRQHIIDHDGCPTGALDVAELLGGCEIKTTDVDRVQLPIVRPADRHHVGCAIDPNRGDTGQAPLAVQIVQFITG